MTFINNALLEGARILVRQASTVDSTPLPSDPAATTAIFTQSPTQAPTSSTMTIPVTDISPTPTPTPSNNGAGSGGGGNSSSPLLFFVALGFGVVFTNLWIIVGVKYCFRYNARNRAMRVNEDGEPINMENMPRPHRRRREKKLMPIDEVNEKFPMMKYKTWVASRAQEGLPTRGGVSSPPSRANSIRDVDGVVNELPSKERMSMEDRPTTSATSPVAFPVAASAPPVDKEEVANSTNGPAKAETAKRPVQHASKESTSSTVGIEPRPSADLGRGFYAPPTTAQQEFYAPSPTPAAQESNKDRREEHDDDDEDDDEHIDAALPPECLGTSGDTCAICIDTLEDDDDVRGLTCGHAFHAVCLDPWLTTRRACCPLCKADYYTPKPRPNAPEGDGATVIAVTLPGDSRSNRMNMPTRPRQTFFGLLRSDRRRSPHAPSNRPESHARGSRSRPTNNGSSFFGLRGERNNTTPASEPTEQPPSRGIFSGIRAAIPGLRRSQNTATPPDITGANQTVTPSQLEAGVRGQSS